MNTNNSKMTPTVVGIDIGAFTAKIASVQRGTIDVITNQANFRETPVVVGFGDGERKIGEIGSVKLKSNFKNTVVSPTRYLGLNASNQQSQRQLQNCPCATKLESDRVYFKVQLNGREESLTAEQVLAGFMTQLTSIIQHNNLDQKLIVFSVPSYFTEIEKKAFLNAAQISGMRNVKLVTEAVAIGMDYGSFKKSELGEGRNVLFIDFGHSKLSMSLIKFGEAKLEVALEKSNRNLGCRDIDKKVFEYMASKFEQKKGLNIKQSKRACLKLLQAIQRQRKILSGISQTQISIQCLMQDEDFSQPFTRQTLTNTSSQIFTQISNLFTSFKSQVQKMGIKIDSIELVGGGSRIPKFVELVESIFEMASSRTINSSQTIAIGATLAAVKESGLFRFNTVNVVNRSALSLVMSWKEIQGDMNEDAEYPALNNKTILQFNQQIPSTTTLTLQTSKKTSILLTSNILDQTLQKILSEISVQTPPENTSQLTLTFTTNQDGFTTLTSVTNNQGKPVQFTTRFFHVLSREEISGFKEKEREMFVRDFGIVKEYQKKNQLEAFIYKQKEILGKDDFKRYVTVLERQNVDKYLTEISQSLQTENNKMTIKDYESKKSEIESQIKSLEQSIKRRKSDLLSHIKQLQKLKTYASDVIKQITQRYRSSKPVTDTCEGIKQVYDWADQIILGAKNRYGGDLPLVSNQEVQEKYGRIKELVNQLTNPQRVYQQQQEQQRAQQLRAQQQRQQQLERQKQERLRAQRQQEQREEQQQQQEQPRHIHYQQHYDPQSRYRQQQQYRPDPYEQMQRSRQRQNNLYSPRGTFYPEQRPQPQPQRRRQQQPQYYDPFGMSRSGFFGNMSGFW